MHRIILAILVIAALITYRLPGGDDGERTDIVEFVTGVPQDRPPERRGFMAEEARARSDDPPAPALWLTGDADTKIYLFGTVHILPDDLEWMNATVAAAIYEADLVWLEAVDFDDPDRYADYVQATGFAPGDLLSAYVTPAEMGEIVRQLLPLGFTLHDIEAMRPWLAAQIISSLPYPGSADIVPGADWTIEDMARGAGIEVAGLESFRQHMDYMSAMPMDLQIAMLSESLDPARSLSLLYETVRPWVAGNVDALEMPMRRGSLESILYGWLIAGRNENWVALMLRMLDEPGTFFIAVGAGHFTGPRSIQGLLEDRGVAVARVQ